MMDPARWTYDPTVDAAYAKVSDKPIKRTEQLSEEVIVDFDADGKVVGVELLDIMDALNAASGKPRVSRVVISGAIYQTPAPPDLCECLIDGRGRAAANRAGRHKSG